MRMIKSASLALYFSIWMGLIVVGTLLGYNMMASSIETLLMDPITGTYNLIVTAFTNPSFVLLATGLTVASLLTSTILGANFSILYIIPMALVITLLNLFMLPTKLLLDANIPAPISAIYVVFIGALTILTILQFTSGRN